MRYGRYTVDCRWATMICAVFVNHDDECGIS